MALLSATFSSSSCLSSLPINILFPELSAYFSYLFCLYYFPGVSQRIEVKADKWRLNCAISSSSRKTGRSYRQVWRRRKLVYFGPCCYRK
ncbi:hypothetical protein ACS0TY_018235 [Phlomoides rotata]